MTACVIVVLGLGGLAYVLAGYPLLLGLVAKLRPRPVKAADIEPFVSILISAFRETRDLPRKVRSLWQLDYPTDRFEVLVADDGSGDGTGELVEELAAEPAAAGRLRLLERTENLGKARQLNRLAEQARGEILIFTDARQPLEPDAVRNLVKVFADPDVGGASGAVEYRTPAGDAVPIGAYWRYESWLREHEARVHSCCGGAGPLLSIRREWFAPLPPEVVLDDMLGPLRLVLAGRRFVYVHDAVALETYAMNRRHEFDRRVRTQAGTFQLLRLEPRLLWPWRNPVWWQFSSHKLGRLMVPWLLLLTLAGTLLGLGQHPAFGVLLALEAGFLAYGVIGWLTAGTPRAPKGSSLAYSLLLLSATALAGLWRDLRGGSTARWGTQESKRR